jgi:hypothetical protein
MATTMYILNHGSTVEVKTCTLDETWSTRRPSVEHLRVLGLLTYVHVSKENKNKPHAKSEEYIFVSYFKDSRVYKLESHIQKGDCIM